MGPLKRVLGTLISVAELRAEIEKSERFIKILVDSEVVAVNRLHHLHEPDHGAHPTPPDLKACPQTAEAISKQMFSEDMDSW